MFNVWPNGDRFLTIIGDVVRSAVERSVNQAFVLGEMVGILCRGDKPRTAVWLPSKQKSAAAARLFRKQTLRDR
jgi:hypothetical protein